MANSSFDFGVSLKVSVILAYGMQRTNIDHIEKFILNLIMLQMSIIFVGPPPTFKCINETMDACSSSCPGYEYDRSVFSETIITQWDLVCENGQLANISHMIFMFGVMAGNLFFGAMADKLVNQVWLNQCTYVM